VLVLTIFGVLLSDIVTRMSEIMTNKAINAKDFDEEFCTTMDA